VSSLSGELNRLSAENGMYCGEKVTCGANTCDKRGGKRAGEGSAVLMAVSRFFCDSFLPQRSDPES